jgi:hypothetical protein
MKKLINVDWGTVLGLLILAVAIYLVAVEAGERVVSQRMERRVFQSTDTGTLVEVQRPEPGRPRIGELPRLSRED